MNYEEFISKIRELVARQFSKETEVTLHKVKKNNGIILDGLVILPAGYQNSPYIYLNNYYKLYGSGMEFTQIVAEIIHIYREHSADMPGRKELLSDFKNIRNRVMYRLVHYGNNVELLADVPHIRFLDLAITFHYLAGQEEDNISTIRIHNSNMAAWGINKRRLFDCARRNTPVLFPAVIRPLDEVISDILRDEAAGFPILPQGGGWDGNNRLYLLSNRAGINGASAILYSDVLKKFADSLSQDLFILPSSIHEVLLLPFQTSIDKKELQDMVADVNCTQVPEEDILSGRVYLYDRLKGTISIC